MKYAGETSLYLSRHGCRLVKRTSKTSVLETLHCILQVSILTKRSTKASQLNLGGLINTYQGKDSTAASQATNNKFPQRSPSHPKHLLIHASTPRIPIPPPTPSPSVHNSPSSPPPHSTPSPSPPHQKTPSNNTVSSHRGDPHNTPAAHNLPRSWSAGTCNITYALGPGFAWHRSRCRCAGPCNGLVGRCLAGRRGRGGRSRSCGGALGRCRLRCRVGSFRCCFCARWWRGRGGCCGVFYYEGGDFEVGFGLGCSCD